MQFVLTPVGFVRGGRSEATDDHWADSICRIEIDPAQFKSEALDGIEAFSHLEIVFVFDKVQDNEIEYGARHPRGRRDWPKVGIFAQRGKNRPNRLGVSVCRLVARRGLALEVQGLDAIDGSPVLDVKPVMKGFQPRASIHEPAWASEIMREYW
ncbi:MAG: SAM-dependent methyltransferase [Hyphomicrobiaceae bacterium]|nr:MAG: SAM-dependent methyltransferase [Hyphomicrobiaceae bacterium]